MFRFFSANSYSTVCRVTMPGVGMTYRRMLYIFAIIKRNHFKMYMFGVVGEAHDYFEVISFYNSRDI